MHKVSIVIPVFNEERYVGQTLEQVISAPTPNLDKEIIVVDDGSTDATASKINEFIAKNSSSVIKLISQPQNAGKCAALKSGFIHSTGDIVIVQDADLEYNPRDYPQLLEPFMKYEADAVYGSRFMGGQPHRVLYFWHYVGNCFLTLLSNALSNLNLTDMETGYKAFKGDVIRKIAPDLHSKRFGFEPEITARLAKIPDIAIYEVAISYRGRTYAQGKKIGWRDGVRAIGEIIRYNIFT